MTSCTSDVVTANAAIVMGSVLRPSPTHGRVEQHREYRRCGGDWRQRRPVSLELGRRAGDLQHEQEADEQRGVVRNERRGRRTAEHHEDREHLGVPPPGDHDTADRDEQAEHERRPRPARSGSSRLPRSCRGTARLRRWPRPRQRPLVRPVNGATAMRSPSARRRGRLRAVRAAPDRCSRAARRARGAGRRRRG